MAVFRISQATLYSIKKQGLAYFEGATIGRDGDSYSSYNTWKKTMARDRKSEQIFRGLPFLSEHNMPSIWTNIQKEAQGNNAFFTTGNEQDLVVLPDLGVIVFSFNG